MLWVFPRISVSPRLKLRCVPLLQAFSAKHPEAEITCCTAREVVPRVLSGSTTQAGAAMATFVMTPGMLGGGVPSPAAAAPGALGVLVIALGLATGMVYVIQMDLPFPVIDPSTGLPANATPGAGGLTGASSGVRGSGAAGGGGGGVGGGGLGAASYATQPSKPISVVELSARPEAGRGARTVSDTLRPLRRRSPRADDIRHRNRAAARHRGS